jgi:hypothetical protein
VAHSKAETTTLVFIMSQVLLFTAAAVAVAVEAYFCFQQQFPEWQWKDPLATITLWIGCSPYPVTIEGQVCSSVV